MDLESNISNIPLRAASYTAQMNLLIKRQSSWWNQVGDDFEALIGTAVNDSLDKATDLSKVKDENNVSEISNKLNQLRKSLKKVIDTCISLKDYYNKKGEKRDAILTNQFQKLAEEFFNEFNKIADGLKNSGVVENEIKEKSNAEPNLNSSIDSDSDDSFQKSSNQFASSEKETHTPKTFYPKTEFVGQYIKDINSLMADQVEWWDVAQKWLNGEYGKKVKNSLTFADQVFKTDYKFRLHKYEESINDFQASLNELIDVTKQADENIRTLALFSSASNNNIRLKNIAQATIDKINIPGTKDETKDTSDSLTPELKSCLHSDEYSIDDEDILGYDLHAANLFNIMTDKQTNPPLNIGILAPWGRGKTSLMRKVEHMFVKEREKKLAENKKENLPKPTLKNLKSWLNNKELFPVYKIPYATVWFNPWNYQSSEMIWAGMANAIVEQVVDQMPNETAKETFWFQLRLARIDKQELRKELQIRATLFVLQFIVWGIALVTAIAMFYINKPAAGWGIIGIGSILGVFSSVASYLKPNKKDIAEVFEKYTKAPQYLNKLGTFHDVQEDLKKVFSLLISEKEPLVIFVDDLDRCSPSKVVEVVEAINVFISGEHRKKCYFVLGMDAEIVAASLDVAYEKMKGKIINRETEQGSLGWYFLDKFIQLPFFIPVINEEKKLDYLESLLKQSVKNNGQGQENTSASVSNLSEQEAQNKAKQALAAPTPEEASKAFENLNKAETKEVEIAILKQQVEENHDDEEISKQVGKYAVYLNSDPRSLKRFANLLRFYNSYQVLRMKKGQKHIPISYLGKYLALMLKFPQLIRWIQWDTENRNGLSTSADIKVKLIDDAINELVKHEKQEERFRYWNDADYLSEDKKITKENIKLIIEMQKDMPWLKSQSLINILMSESMEEAELSNALKCNVW